MSARHYRNYGGLYKMNEKPDNKYVPILTLILGVPAAILAILTIMGIFRDDEKGSNVNNTTVFETTNNNTTDAKINNDYNQSIKKDFDNNHTIKKPSDEAENNINDKEILYKADDSKSSEVVNNEEKIDIGLAKRLCDNKTINISYQPLKGDSRRYKYLNGVSVINIDKCDIESGKFSIFEMGNTDKEAKDFGVVSRNSISLRFSYYYLQRFIVCDVRAIKINAYNFKGTISCFGDTDELTPREADIQL